MAQLIQFLRNVSIGVAVVILAIWLYLAQPSFSSSEEIKIPVDIPRLKHVVQKLSIDLHPRSFRHSTNLNACADYIQSELEAAGGRIEIQNFEVSGSVFKNVRAFFGPEDGPRTIIGAHYDSHDHTPGADDNASGIAGLIELAYLFGNKPPPIGIELVAYCLEEPPFFATKKMGSYIHAQAVAGEAKEIRGMLALETIGYFSDEFGSQDYPALLFKFIYPNRGNFVAVVGRIDQKPFISEVKIGMKGATDVPVYSIAAPTQVPGVDFSDHRNYWEFGYNAVMITDTAFYRNKEYHQAGDTWERLDYERMGKVIQAVYSTVLNDSK